MPSPLLSILASLGAGNSGYRQGTLDDLKLKQAQQSQDANSSYLAALQALSSPPAAASPPIGPGQSSLPITNPTPSPASSLLPPGSGSAATGPLPAAVANNPLPLSDAQRSPPRGLPITTPLPSMQAPDVIQSPSPPQQSAPQQRTDYMGLVNKVVAAVNQAMPNADPATKSMVARELMETAVKGQESDQQKQNAFDLKNSQLSERERNDATIAGIRQQIANTSQNQGQQKIDLSAQNLALKSKAAETKDQVTYTPATIDKLAKAAANGIPISRLVPGLGANNPNRIAVENRATELNPDLDLAAAEVGFKGRMSEAGTVGTGAGKVDLSSRLLDETIPLARAAISQVDLSNFTDYNALHNYALRHTSDKNLAAADAALQGVASDYAQLLVRNGTSTDASRSTADALANMKMGPEALEGFFGQVEKESAAARRATKKAQQDVGGSPGQNESNSSSSQDIPPPPPGFMVQ